MISNPSGIAIDKFANLYFSDGNSRIRKVSASGIITTIAGNGNYGYSGDNGIATAAMIYDPHGIAIDSSDNLYFADQENNRIRKVSSLGIITTVAGTGFYGYNGDKGPATMAELQPWGIAVDDFGNIFVTDFAGNAIRQINSSGFIYTIAGNGVAGYAGDGGAAASAEFNDPSGIIFDNCDNIYVADALNNRVRKVTFPICDYLNVNSINEEKHINIYPNPTIDKLNIDNLETQATYYLLNIIGSVVQQGPLSEGNNSIDIRSTANGMYMLEVVDEEGEKMLKKFVKE